MSHRVPSAYHHGFEYLGHPIRSKACYRLMLLAGADPLVKFQGSGPTVLSNVLECGTSVSLINHFQREKTHNVLGRAPDVAL